MSLMMTSVFSALGLLYFRFRLQSRLRGAADDDRCRLLSQRSRGPSSSDALILDSLLENPSPVTFAWDSVVGPAVTDFAFLRDASACWEPRSTVSTTVSSSP
jgi:hypothetical protein